MTATSRWALVRVRISPRVITTDIGNQGVAVESNTIRIGTNGFQSRIFIAGTHKTSADPSRRMGSSRLQSCVPAQNPASTYPL